MDTQQQPTRLVVLDTNCIIRMLPSASPYHKAWTDYMADGRYRLVVTNEIISEYEEIIGRLVSPRIASDIVEAIARSPHTVHAECFFRFRLIEQDPDDNKFVDCAITAGADYIVSEDAHFRVLATIPFPAVSVIRLEEFMQTLEEEEKEAQP